jgi:hypothetical protein
MVGPCIDLTTLAGCHLAVGPANWKLEIANMQPYVAERDGGYYVAGTRVSLDGIVHAFEVGESPISIGRWHLTEAEE